MAGVINFVTRRTFDGVMVDGQYGIGSQYHQWDTNLTAGTVWNSGGVYFSYNHAFHDAILGGDRSYAKTFPDANGNLALTCNPGNVQVGTAIYGLPFTGATAVAKPNQCNNASGNSIYPSERRDSVYGRFAQDIGQAVKVDVSAYFTDSAVGVHNGPYQALSPLTVTPDADVALWLSTSSAPTMSLMNCAPGDCIRGFRMRSITNLKVCAVTGWFEGGENVKPLRIVNVTSSRTGRPPRRTLMSRSSSRPVRSVTCWVTCCGITALTGARSQVLGHRCSVETLSVTALRKSRTSVSIQVW